MEKINCRSAEAYPEVIATCPNNQHDIAVFRPLYAGLNSELTAILQYGYQDLVLSGVCGEVASTIKSISMVEMHHLHLLGQAICILGGNPKYVNPQTECWWNASAVNYNGDLCKALLGNLKCETEAYQAYLQAAEKVKNPTLCALLRRIAADEKMHMELFTSMINCHCRGR